MMISKLKFPKQLEPFKGVIYFVLVLFTSNFLWKMSISGDESDKLVLFYGNDISAPFTWMATHMAHMSGDILKILGWNLTVDNENVLRHANKGFYVQVIWACSGIKQAYICFCILAFAYGPRKTKLWYVPAGLLLIYVFNLFRIVFITAYCNVHPGSFDFLHLYVFKYGFYGLIFLLWVIWEEKIAVPYRKSSQ